MPTEEEKKLEKLAAIADEWEMDDLADEMTGKTAEQRAGIIAREGATQEQTVAARQRMRAKLADRMKELDKSAPTETPAVKPASTHAPAPERSNVIELSTRRRIMRWAAGSGAAGIVLAAGIFGVVLKSADLEIRHPVTPLPVPTHEALTPEDLRRSAFEECFAQEFDNCLRTLDAAAEGDPHSDQLLQVRQAREYARQHKAQ